MSAPEPVVSPDRPADHGEYVESRSKIKVTRNAKGDPQWEIQIVAGEDEQEIIRLRTIAVAQHQALVAALVGSAT